MPASEDTGTGRSHGGKSRDALLAAALDHFAQRGIGDASLRQIAAGIGTSHRMLIYHFGSRDGLLSAVVDVLEKQERAILAEMTSNHELPLREQAWRFWQHVADVVDFYGPLYFELASHAMRGPSIEEPLRAPNVEMWVDALTELWEAGGLGTAEARVLSRLNLAVSRGLLHDLLLTGDRRAVDTAMAMFDVLVFREEHPLAEVRSLVESWHPD